MERKVSDFKYQGPEPWPSITSENVTYSPPANTFYLTYRGSQAHGMYVPKNDPNSIDDIDLMGFIFGEPKDYIGLSEWGSRGTKETKDGPWDVVIYEAKKAVSLLLQGNPNIMSMLWVKPAHVIWSTPASKELVANRNLFVGKHVYNAFAGYAYQQLEKMETRDPAELREYLAVTAELKFRGIHPNHKGEVVPFYRLTGEDRNVDTWDSDKLFQRLKSFQKKGENIGYMGDKRKQLVLEHGYDSKNAAHLIRLLRMCIEFMQTGEMIVFRPDASELLDIKQGKWKLEDVKKLSSDLFEDAKQARDNSRLPEGPDRDKAEKLLISIIRENVFKNGA